MSAASIRPSRRGWRPFPVFVRDDLSPVHQVAWMLVENHDREGLTPTEEAVAIQQLAGFEGVTQKDITAMTGIKAGVVRTALKVASSEVATAIGERHDLTMEQLLVLAEFDNDTEAVKALTVSAVKDPPASTTWWPSYGGTATTVPPTTPSLPRSPRPAYRWSSWRTAGGSPTGRPTLDELPARRAPSRFTPAKHRACPGHAGAVSESDDGYEVAYLCLDPVGHGHVDQPKAAHGTRRRPPRSAPGMTDEQKTDAARSSPTTRRGRRPPRCAVTTSPSSWPVAPCPKGPCAT